MTPRRIGLVADDLTGAADSAAQFASVGWHALVVVAGPGGGVAAAEPAADVLAVVTGVRAGGHDDARTATRTAVESLLAQGCDRLYVKVDSTMRGAVSGQIQGALAAWSALHPAALAVLCPAFPEQGRTVVDGEVLVDGVPLAATAAATDPVSPVRVSGLGELVPGARPAAAHELTSGSVSCFARGDEKVAYVDAATDADLAEIAAALDRLGAAGVAVGSAGLAAALARRWPRGPREDPLPAPPARVLVGVSSLHPVALEALERLRHATTRADCPLPAVDVVTPPPERTNPIAAAAIFAERVAQRVLDAPCDALVLVGGDGAAAALASLGATAVRVQATLAPGVPVGRITGGAADGIVVVTTSGGFGGPDCLVRIVRDLRSRSNRGRDS